MHDAQWAQGSLVDNLALCHDLSEACTSQVCSKVTWVGWQPTSQAVGIASACVYADADGNILDNPPLANDIAQDPLLQSLKLIAWVADDTLLPRLGERGFPHWGIWAERNKAFQRDITSWLAHNQSGLASAVATR